MSPFFPLLPDYNTLSMAVRSDLRRPPFLAAGALVLAALCWAPEAWAWTPKTQVLIADSAAAVAPPDLRRQIEKHIGQFRSGAVDPFQDFDAVAHCGDRQGGDIDQWILASAERAVGAIRAHRPFRDIVYELGVLSHYLADANNPLSAADSDPLEERYSIDYLNYVEDAQERFTLAFYSDGREVEDPAALAQMLDRTRARGLRFYPQIGVDYRRIGGPPGSEKFDDKSVAFAIGSLALSHAVSDIGAVLRYIWIEAGGADQRELTLSSPTDGDRGR